MVYHQSPFTEHGTDYGNMEHGKNFFSHEKGPFLFSLIETIYSNKIE